MIILDFRRMKLAVINMAARILIIIILLGLFSCQNLDKKTPNVPKWYSLQMSWGTYWNNQNIHKLMYTSSKDSLTILIQTIDDSITSKTKYRIDKLTADSLFVLAYQNNKTFNLLDTNYAHISDGDNISITIHANNQSLTNSYISQPSHRVSNEISRIISIIRRETRDTTLFNL
jgi:hypothetical protein